MDTLTPDVTAPLSRRARGTQLLWAGITILLPGLLVSVLSMSTVDLAYAIRAGGQILDGAGIPRIDTYTFTAAGLTWIDQQWLAQAIFSAIHRLGGWPALAALWAVIIVAIEALLWRAARCMGAGVRTTGATLLLAFVIAAQGSSLRSQVLGLLCLAALIVLVVDRSNHRPRLWLVIPLFATWANVHGSFPVGLAFMGMATLEDTVRRNHPREAVATLALAAAATLVNPFGLDVWRYVATIGSDPTIARFVTEWRHTNLFDAAGAAFYASVAAVGVIVLVCIRQGERPSWTVLVWLAGLALLGAWAVRAVAWWAVGAAPIAAALLARVRVRRRGREAVVSTETASAADRPGVARGPIVFVATLVILLVVLQPSFHPSPDGQGIGSRLEDAPAGITRALSAVVAATPAARVFNAQRWGSWFELAVPQARIFADSRIELIPAGAWGDYLKVSAGDPRWHEILDTWQVSVVVVSATDQAALLTLVSSDSRWHVVYRDSDGLVAARTAP
jgi:hypothetical protein